MTEFIGIFIILILHQPKFEQKGYDVMKRKYPNHVIFRNSNFDFDVCNAISATDCTGLIPWAPNSEEQLDSYDEIINYSPESANIYNYDK